MKQLHKHVLARLSSEVWALPSDFIRLVHDIVVDRPDISPQDLEKFRKMREPTPYRAIGPLSADPVGDRPGIMRVGPIGLMAVQGPILRYADFFSAISGGTTLDDIAADFLALEADPQVESIIQIYDSPGGQATGVLETANLFARGDKPLTAYAEGAMLSAAYALGSAADRIVIGPMAEVGSVGVAAMVRTGKPKDRLELVSSQTPRKRPDAATEEGRRELQSRVDALGAEFIDAVARMRGISTDDVAGWQGGIATGNAAIGNRMADGQSVLLDLLTDTGGPMAKKDSAVVAPLDPAAVPAIPDPVASEPIAPADPPPDQAAMIEQNVAMAVGQERDRILAALVQADPQLESRLGDKVWTLVWDGKSTDGDVAKAVLAAERERGAQVGQLTPALTLVPAKDPSGSTKRSGGVKKPDTPEEQWEKDPELQTEFRTAEVYAAYVEAEKNGLINNAGHTRGQQHATD